jgi:hypothetical protein
MRAADLRVLMADYATFEEHTLLTGEEPSMAEWAEQVEDILEHYLSQDIRLTRSTTPTAASPSSMPIRNGTCSGSGTATGSHFISPCRTLRDVGVVADAIHTPPVYRAVV